MEVWTAKGKAVHQTLVDKVTANLFAGIMEDVSLAKQQNEAGVTFLTANGLKATASIGTFKGLKAQWRKDRDSQPVR